MDWIVLLLDCKMFIGWYLFLLELSELVVEFNWLSG